LIFDINLELFFLVASDCLDFALIKEKEKKAAAAKFNKKFFHLNITFKE
jgi:hypothetical protein